MKTIEKISMLGLGKLGLPTLAFYASRGCAAVGMDQSEALVSDLEKGIIHSEEPGLRETYLEHRDRIIVTSSVEKAVANSDITFVIVPTPSLPSGEFSTKFVRETAVEIGKAMRSKNDWHLAVLVSTVLPGETRECFLKIIEENSGKACGEDFGVCYSPEFIALGSVIHDLGHPDFILIGESDDRAGSCLEKFQEKILPGTPKRRMSLENAELAKITVNTFVTTKISYANMLAEICEKADGMDANVVTKAIGLDSRIGSRYLSAGLGYGGPCFPRDNKALGAFAKKIGARADIAIATDEINNLQTSKLVRRIRDLTSNTDAGKLHAAVLGLSYKKDTSVIERSQGFEIVERLLQSGFGEVIVYDHENTLLAARKILGDKISYAHSLDDAVYKSDVIVIAVQDQQFVPWVTTLKNDGSKVIVADPWRIMDETSLPPHAIYCTVGKI